MEFSVQRSSLQRPCDNYFFVLNNLVFSLNVDVIDYLINFIINYKFFYKSNNIIRY